MDRLPPQAPQLILVWLLVAAAAGCRSAGTDAGGWVAATGGHVMERAAALLSGAEIEYATAPWRGRRAVTSAAPRRRWRRTATT